MLKTILEPFTKLSILDLREMHITHQTRQCEGLNRDETEYLSKLMLVLEKLIINKIFHQKIGNILSE